MHQQLVGNESNLVGYWKLNGDFTDSTSNANTLTAQASATATTVDNSMNSTEFGIITKVTSTQITVFTGTDYGIPNMTLSNPYYSTYRAPFGFPNDRGRWRIQCISATGATSVGAFNQWFNNSSQRLTVPIGKWEIGYNGTGQQAHTSAASADFYTAIGTSTNGTGFYTDQYVDTFAHPYNGANVNAYVTPVSGHTYVSYDSATVTYLNYRVVSGAGTITAGNGSWMNMYADCAYL
jgi:hypothetical protein